MNSFCNTNQAGGEGDEVLEIRYVCKADEAFWFSLDKHLSRDEFALKIRDKRGYVICLDGNPIGVMRYNLFLDNTPFLTLIYIEEAHQGKGYGKEAMLFWENEMLGLPAKSRFATVRTLSAVDFIGICVKLRTENADARVCVILPSGLETPRLKKISAEVLCENKFCN